MIHVVQVLSDTNIGGAGKYLLNYLKYYDRTQFRVTVILPIGSRLAEFVQACPDAALIEAPYMADVSYDKRCVAYLKDVLTELKPSLLHTHASLSARIAGRKAGVPVILATRHCIEPVPHGIKALALATANNALCDYYIAVADAVVKNLTDCGIKKDKIKLVNNGVEPVRRLTPEERAKEREALGLSSQNTAFGIFARLEPVKGHKYFIKAARQVLKEEPHARFFIVGSGSQEEELKRLTAHYGLEDKVIFTGFAEDTTPLLNAMDVNVNASESEAMSLSVLEAMSLGLPSIATKNGGNRELVHNEVNGLLVGFADSASMALAMTRLIRDTEARTHMAANAAQSYQQNYTVQTMVNRLEKVYKEVLQDAD